jgi:hypothetical protein
VELLVPSYTFWGTPERRAAPRYAIQQGTFTYFYALGGRSTAIIRDLSLGGVYIGDKSCQFKEGTELDVELLTDDGPAMFRGVVTRSYPQQGFAVRFLEYSGELRERLERYLRDLTKRAPREDE